MPQSLNVMLYQTTCATLATQRLASYAKTSNFVTVRKTAAADSIVMKELQKVKIHQRFAMKLKMVIGVTFASKK